MRTVALSRQAWAARGGSEQVAPVRMVHLGLGSFHRSHQAWYTAHSEDADKWGIAAFTGRSLDGHRALAGQEGLYTLTTRGPDGDACEVVGSIVAVHAAHDTAALAEYLTDPAVAVVTLTITEHGYDVTPTMPSTLRRLADALEARRQADIGPIAVVPCDNVVSNAEVVRAKLGMLADQHYPGLREWIDECVSCVATSVDRITPRWDGQPLKAVKRAGWVDASPVITEPFSDWVLQGDFPAGRPAWEGAGASFVTDIEPFERRKLWLLNGAHTIMAWSGMARGLATVADAVADQATMDTVAAYWDEALPHLSNDVDTEGYRELLMMRWHNRRIEHPLAQIATDSATKLRSRIAQVAMHEIRAGRDAPACAGAMALWIRGVMDVAVDNAVLLDDALAKQVGHASRSADPVRALVQLVDADLAEVAEFVEQVRVEVTPGR